MIKIWCEFCLGAGNISFNKSNLTTSELQVFGEECKSCQGKGYTELEAAIVGDNNDIEVFAQLDLRSNGQWEVYIKEVKEDTK